MTHAGWVYAMLRAQRRADVTGWRYAVRGRLDTLGRWCYFVERTQHRIGF